MGIPGRTGGVCPEARQWRAHGLGGGVGRVDALPVCFISLGMMHRMKWGQVLIRVVINLLSCSCGHEAREEERGSLLINTLERRIPRAGGRVSGQGERANSTGAMKSPVLQAWEETSNREAERNNFCIGI